MRRLLLALLLIVAPAVVASAPPAAAICDADQGCSPCGPQLVIDGKNTRLEPVYC